MTVRFLEQHLKKSTVTSLFWVDTIVGSMPLVLLLRMLLCDATLAVSVTEPCGVWCRSDRSQPSHGEQPHLGAGATHTTTSHTAHVTRILLAIVGSSLLPHRKQVMQQTHTSPYM